MKLLIDAHAYKDSLKVNNYTKTKQENDSLLSSKNKSIKDSLQMETYFRDYKRTAKKEDADSLIIIANKILNFCVSYFRKNSNNKVFYFDKAENFFLENISLNKFLRDLFKEFIKVKKC